VVTAHALVIAHVSVKEELAGGLVADSNII